MAKTRTRPGLTPAIYQEVVGPLDDRAFCAYCGFIAEEVDHIIPVSRGGGDALENLTPACWECNHEKTDLTVDEWAANRRADGKPWPVPSLNDRIAFLIRWGGRPRLERVNNRISVIRDYEKFRALVVATRNVDVTADLAGSKGGAALSRASGGPPRNDEGRVAPANVEESPNSNTTDNHDEAGRFHGTALRHAKAVTK